MGIVKKQHSLLMMFSSFQMLYRFSVNIVVPFFSVILLSAGWSESNITYFFSVAALTVFLLAPAIGRISDFYSKKLIMLFGLITQVIFFILYYFFIEIMWVVYVARVIEIIGFIAITVVGFGALEDLIKSKRGLWTGIFLSFGTIGALVGPIIAGYVSELYREEFLFLLGAMASFIAMIFLFFVPLETPIKHHRDKESFLQQINPLAEIKHFISTKRMRGMAIFGILMNARAQIFAIFFPIYVIKELGYSESYLGFLLTIPIVMHLLQTPLGKFSDSISAQFGVLTGVFINCFALFFLPYINSISYLVIMLGVMGIGASLWNVSAWTLMGEYAKANNVEGKISGTYFSLAKLGGLIATLSASSLLTLFNISIMIQLFAIIILVSMIFVYFLFQPIFHHEKTPNHFIKHFS